MPTENILAKEPMKIVILGGSFAGLSVAHNFLRNTFDKLGKTRTAPRYKVVLISPSTHLYWNIGAPRALVAKDLLPPDKLFFDILGAFEDYPSGRFEFVQGSAIGIDFSQRSVTVSLCTPIPSTLKKTRPVEPTRWSQTSSSTGKTTSIRESVQTVAFHALVIATGSSAQSPLLSLHGQHQNTEAALDKFHAALRDASSIVIAGGGPSGVECAGQLATYFNHKSGTTRRCKAALASKSGQEEKTSPVRRFVELCACKLTDLHARQAAKSESLRSPKNISLISGNERLLPRLPQDVANKAEAKLRKLGVHIMHDVRVISAQELPSGVTKCTLSNDLTIGSDLYIAATGVRPNTDFMPAELLDASGYVLSDPQYLRLDRAGERVYAIGDCAAYSKNTILDVYESIPVLMHNMRNDLWEYEFKLQNPYGGAEDKIAALQDVQYLQNPKETQLVPITRFGGVGVLFDVKLPSFMVWIMKGRDYRVGKAKSVSMMGSNPYASPV